ncbi:hypothetical protein BC834DRAFT_814831 [Gloeopeniophorella convolvens]|nr:hypothetical protein BC834DRAFT_814831 [Gloeopeniophorella convolvens]
MATQQTTEILEVEDEEQRQRRLQDILENLNVTGPETASRMQPPPMAFDFGERRTYAMEPPTELLSRIQQFLPQIAQSNADLVQRDPRSIDIEHIEETDERVIQMASCCSCVPPVIAEGQ